MVCPSVDYGYVQIYSGGGGSGIWGDDEPFFPDVLRPRDILGAQDFVGTGDLEAIPVGVGDPTIYSYIFTETTEVLPSNSSVAASHPDLVGETLYILTYVPVEGEDDPSLEQAFQAVYVPEYVDSFGLTAVSFLYLLPSDEASELFPDGLGIAPDFTYDGTNFFEFLYGIGAVMVSDNGVVGLLTLEIMGVPFIQLFLTVGFAVFATWTIVKWVIP